MKEGKAKKRRTRVAIVGCGYVADSYLKTFANHPELEVVGVMDRDQGRAFRLSSKYRLPVYSTLDEVLADPRSKIVLNLTNPRSHFEISRASLEAGKHVYSEKPLAVDLPQAEELIAMAERLGLLLTSAPCSLLGESRRLFGGCFAQRGHRGSAPRIRRIGRRADPPDALSQVDK